MLPYVGGPNDGLRGLIAKRSGVPVAQDELIEHLKGELAFYTEEATRVTDQGKAELILLKNELKERNKVIEGLNRHTQRLETVNKTLSKDWTDLQKTYEELLHHNIALEQRILLISEETVKYQARITALEAQLREHTQVCSGPTATEYLQRLESARITAELGRSAAELRVQQSVSALASLEHQLCQEQQTVKGLEQSISSLQTKNSIYIPVLAPLPPTAEEAQRATKEYLVLLAQYRVVLEQQTTGEQLLVEALAVAKQTISEQECELSALHLDIQQLLGWTIESSTGVLTLSNSHFSVSLLRDASNSYTLTKGLPAALTQLYVSCVLSDSSFPRFFSLALLN